MNTETVRTDLMVIGRALEEYEQFITAIAEARFRYEMLSRSPELIPETKSLEDFRANVETLIAESEKAGDVLMHLTQTSSVANARRAYMSLLIAYQRVQNVGELASRKIFDEPSVQEELAKQNVVSTEELQALEQEALENLEALMEVTYVPAIPPAARIPTGPSTFVLK